MIVTVLTLMIVTILTLMIGTDMPDIDMLDTRGVAEIMNVKPDTVRWYHKKGLMPKADYRFGNALVWKRSTIDEWMSQ